MASRVFVSLVGANGKVIGDSTHPASQEVAELRRAAARASGLPEGDVRLYLRAGAVRELTDDTRTLGAEIGAALPPLSGSPQAGAKVRTRVEVIQKQPGFYDSSEYVEHERGRPDAIIPVGTTGSVQMFEYGLATISFTGFDAQVWGEKEMLMLGYEPQQGFSIEVRGDDKPPKSAAELAAARSSAVSKPALAAAEAVPAGSESLLARLSDAVSAKDQHQLDKVLTAMSTQADIDMSDFEEALRPIFRKDKAAETFFQKAIVEYSETAHLKSAHTFERMNIYMWFRMTAMHYGPSLRPIQAGWQHGAGTYFGDHRKSSEALSVMQDETIETWEARAYMQGQVGLLDGALQAQSYMGGTPAYLLDNTVQVFKDWQKAAAASAQSAQG